MKRFLIALTCILLCSVAAYYFAVTNRYVFNATPGQGGDLKVGHVNICGFAASSDRSLSAARMLRCSSDAGVDVLLVQEFSTDQNFDEKEFRSLAAKYFNYVSIEGECAVLSKYPISSHDRILYSGSSGMFSSILIKAGDRDVRIFAPHLRTTGLYYFGYGNELFGGGKLTNARVVMQQNRAIRINQARCLRTALNGNKVPVIVAGDFNSMPMSRVMRIIQRSELKDSFLEKGVGKGSTFIPLGDQLRIDAILHDDSFECTEARVIQDELSDHRMITASFLFK